MRWVLCLALTSKPQRHALHQGQHRKAPKLPSWWQAPFSCRDMSHGGLPLHSEQAREEALSKLSAIVRWNLRHTGEDTHITSAKGNGLKQ